MAERSATAGERSLRAPLALSGVLHLGALAAVLLVRAPETPPRPPTYRVNLVAAPPGPRAVGVVQPPAPTPAPETKAPSRPVTERPPEPTAPTTKTAPVRRAPPRRATPTPTPTEGTKTQTKTAAPRAGGGPEGGRGADVANVQTAGIEFPFPGYLENVVRQIALRFSAPRGAALKAEVSFLIHRDGTISNLRISQRSGSYAFDLEARGAVEKAARERAFGPLPAGFPDDVLPVIFSFDPRLLR